MFTVQTSHDDGQTWVTGYRNDWYSRALRQIYDAPDRAPVERIVGPTGTIVVFRNGESVANVGLYGDERLFKISAEERALWARLSEVLPQFDPRIPQRTDASQPTR